MAKIILNGNIEIEVNETKEDIKNLIADKISGQEQDTKDNSLFFIELTRLIPVRHRSTNEIMFKQKRIIDLDFKSILFMYDCNQN